MPDKNDIIRRLEHKLLKAEGKQRDIFDLLSSQKLQLETISNTLELILAKLNQLHSVVGEINEPKNTT